MDNFIEEGLKAGDLVLCFTKGDVKRFSGGCRAILRFYEYEYIVSEVRYGGSQRFDYIIKYTLKRAEKTIYDLLNEDIEDMAQEQLKEEDARFNEKLKAIFEAEVESGVAESKAGVFAECVSPYDNNSYLLAKGFYLGYTVCLKELTTKEEE